MVEFYRDLLDGPLYIVITVLSVIFIMAIIGFIMERKQLERERNAQIVHVESNLDAVASNLNTKEEQMQQITPQITDEVVVNQDVILNNNSILENNSVPLENNTSEVKTPVYIFEDNSNLE